MQLSLLSVLNTPMTTEKWVNSFAKGSIGVQHILDSPYMSMRDLTPEWQKILPKPIIMCLHQELERRCPIYQYCLTMLQRGYHKIMHAMFDLRVLNAQTLSRMEGQGMEDIRAPEEAMRTFRSVGLLQNNLQFDRPLEKRTLYNIGNVELKNSVVKRTLDIMSTLTGKIAQFVEGCSEKIAAVVGLSNVEPAASTRVADAALVSHHGGYDKQGVAAATLGTAGMETAVVAGSNHNVDQEELENRFAYFMRGVTLEYALMPYLFPDGRGYFRPGMTGARNLTEYLRHRMKQLLSPFTLTAPYILHMYMVRQSNILSEGVSVQLSVGWNARSDAYMITTS
jgi:hypothetical protein